MADTTGATIKNGVARIEVDTKIYEQDAILTASYHYIDDFYVFLARKEKSGGIAVELTPKNRKAAAALKARAAGFYNILLAETLRLRIHKQSRKFREEMLEKAIASALSPPKTQAAGRKEPPRPAGKDTLELDEELKKIIEKVKNMDYRDDPLGIAVPVTDVSSGGKAGGARRKGKS